MSSRSKPSDPNRVKKSPQPKGPGGGVQVDMDALKKRVAAQENIRYKGGGKRRPSTKFLDAGKAWRAHLDEYRKAHPNMSLKQQMRGAKKTYKKSKSQPIHVRNTQYSVQIRPRTRKAGKRKTKRPKKRTTKKKRSLFGLF